MKFEINEKFLEIQTSSGRETYLLITILEMIHFIPKNFSIYQIMDIILLEKETNSMQYDEDYYFKRVSFIKEKMISSVQ